MLYFYTGLGHKGEILVQETDKTFKIITRRNTKGKRYYQVRFFDSDGHLMKSKSFPVGMNKPEVGIIAAEMLPKIIAADDETDALAYCVSFWSPESKYFTAKSTRKKTLSESYRRSGESFIKKAVQFLAGRKTSRITTVLLEDFETELLESGLSIRSARGVIEAIARPVNVYRKKHNMPPLGKIEHGQDTARARGTFSLDEIKRVVEYTGDYRDRLIFLLGALCGLRLGEMRGLMVTDISENNTIIVQHNVVFKSEGIKKTKNKRQRKVPLPAVVADAINMVQGECPSRFVIPNRASPDRPSDQSTFRRAFPRILRAIGITEEIQKERNLVLHSLRHTYITLVQEIGINKFAAQYLAGHQSQAITQRYTHAENVVDFETAGSLLNNAVMGGGGKDA